jgi:hypothetical protein
MEAAWQQARSRVCPDLGTEPYERIGEGVGLNRRLTESRSLSLAHGSANQPGA